MTKDIDAAESVLREIADLCRRETDVGIRTGTQLTPWTSAYSYEDYCTLHVYLVTHFQQHLRRELVKIQYPSIPLELWETSGDNMKTSSLQGQSTESSRLLVSIQSTVHKLHEIAVLHEEVTRSRFLEQDNKASKKQIKDPLLDHPVLQELCRPIFERVRFHFVSQPDKVSPSHSTSAPPKTQTRIDRLAEWLLGYMREHVFQPYGPWEWISYYGVLPDRAGSASSATADDFVSEMIRLIQWVLAERNFFRDPLVCGPSSQPIVLCRAVEQLLQFDAFLQTELYAPPHMTLASMQPKRRFVSLVDVCIAGDDELFAWWLNRERECAIATLFDDDAVVAHQTTTWTSSMPRVSSRAELFCALIRSIRSKVAVFAFSAPYITNVASPLCMRFLDAVHETATDLTRQLTGKQQSLRFSRNHVPTDSELATLITGWIEMINGAHMASQTLSQAASTQALNPADEDMARFGQSLGRLQGIMVDDFATATVEVLLMERAKFAGYLMRCSHLLASASEDYMVGDINIAKLSDISPDLVETHRIVSGIMDCCNELDELPVDHIENFAPRVMCERIMSLLAEKLLEVALDLQGMTPDLRRPGCVLFARDVISLFGENRSLPNHALRVLDVVRLMRMESTQLGAIGGALCGLAGIPAPLTEADFEGDDKLFEEATSMIRAKGLTYIELADVFAVLNRRRDLR